VRGPCAGVRCHFKPARLYPTARGAQGTCENQASPLFGAGLPPLVGAAAPARPARGWEARRQSIAIAKTFDAAAAGAARPARC